MKELDPKLLPGGKYDPDGQRRLVFVGDIHGCKDELTKLLAKVSFDEATDHLIPTGDTISKGPDNPGVLDELIRLGATSPRGNHEDRLLSIANSKSDQDLLPSIDTSSNGYARDVALLRHLKPHHLHYLRDMPLMLHIPPLPLARPPTWKTKSPIAEDILVVHAGIVPCVPLARQDPYYVMNMRSIHAKTHVPSVTGSKDGGGKPWIDLWSWYSERLFKGKPLKPYAQEDEGGDDDDSSSWLSTFNPLSSRRKKPIVVVYGHDSKAGRQIKRWVKGLDSGCVAGGELTALVMDAKGRTKVHSVGCKDWKS